MKTQEMTAMLPSTLTLVKIVSEDGDITFSWQENGLTFSCFMEGQNNEKWDIAVSLSKSTLRELPPTKEIKFELSEEVQLPHNAPRTLLVKSGDKKAEVQILHPIIDEFPFVEGTAFKISHGLWEIISQAALLTETPKDSTTGTVLITVSLGVINVYGGILAEDRTLIMWGYEIRPKLDTRVREKVFIPTDAIRGLTVPKDSNVLLEISPGGNFFRLSLTGMEVHGAAPAGDWPTIGSLPQAKEDDSSKMALTKVEAKRLKTAIEDLETKFSPDSLVTVAAESNNLVLRVVGTQEEKKIGIKSPIPTNQETTVMLSLLLDLARTVLLANGLSVFFPGVIGHLLNIGIEGVGVYYLLSTVKQIIESKDSKSDKEEEDQLPAQIQGVYKDASLQKVEVTAQETSPPQLPEGSAEAVASMRAMLAKTNTLLSKPSVAPKHKEELQKKAALLESLLAKHQAKTDHVVGAVEIQQEQETLKELREVHAICVEIFNLQQKIISILLEKYPLPAVAGKIITYVAA